MVKAVDNVGIQLNDLRNEEVFSKMIDDVNRQIRLYDLYEQ